MKNKLKHEKLSKDKNILKLVYSKWHKICNNQTLFCHRSKFGKSDIINLTNKFNSYKTPMIEKKIIKSNISGKKWKNKRKNYWYIFSSKTKWWYVQSLLSNILKFLGIGKFWCRILLIKKNWKCVFRSTNRKVISDDSLDIENKYGNTFKAFRP